MVVYRFTLLVVAAWTLLGSVLGQGYTEWTIDIPKDKTIFQTAGVKLITSTVRTLPFVRYTTSCARLCANDVRCQSFNFHPKEKVCELNSGRETPDFMGFIKEPGWEFYAMEWFKIDSTGLGPCASKKCPEGAACLEMCDRNGFAFADCVCLQSKKQKINCKNRTPARWSEWSEFGQCSKSCGLGLRNRDRNCTHPHVDGMLISSDNCEGIPKDIEVCDMGKCPAWKPWSDWSECSAKYVCGEGVRNRNRTCAGGIPNVDELCTGDESETEPCFQQKCDSPIRLVGTENYGEGRVEIYNDIDESWGGVCATDWDKVDGKIACKQALDLNDVSEVTGGSEFGNIMFPVMLSGINCIGNESSIQECNHQGWRPLDQRCREGAAGVRCVVNGIWGEWSTWSECSTSCDWGFYERTRECNHPPPLHGGKECGGFPRQRKKCYLMICPIDGVWMSWSSWGGCSLTCGVGYRYRNRTCDGPYYEGAPCPTVPEGEIGIQECNTQRCPFRNCHEYRIVDGENAPNSSALVDPDGPGDLKAYYIECDNFAEPGNGISVLNHDSMIRNYVQGYEARGEYERQIAYRNASLEQAKALVDSSERCEQFVSWECKSASIHEPVHTYEENKTLTLTFVTGRDSEQLDYFPGGEPGTESCTCWQNRTCSDPKRWCNCDANLDDQVLVDAGVVDRLEHLPLTAFFAGDTGATWEEGWHTIGPLKCWGTTKSLMPGQTHPMESIRPTETPVFG